MNDRPKFVQSAPVLLAHYFALGPILSIPDGASFNDPLFRPFWNLSPLSDSSISLFASGNMSFDVAAPPIPQAGGSKIVFASSRDGFMQIYLMNSDGTGQLRLTTDGSNNDNPRWSPDGTKILFQSDRDNPGSGLYDIYVMNANGSSQTRLTTDANDDCNASWSADGSKIVFQSFRNAVNCQVYTMNADGSGQTNISNNAVNDRQPSWSPDGTKIAFASDRDQPGFPSVYVMNANGTNQTRLTFSGTSLRDEQPVWSPNGSKIAFASTRDSVTESWTETDDYEILEDDGQTFPKSRLNINKEVYVMNPNGSSQTRLTNNLSNDDSPTWSTDGAKIVFRSERERDEFDATPQIWTMNPDGSGQANLSNSGDSDYSPSWTSGSANQSPVAVPGGPYSGVVGQNAPFNGGSSYDPDGTIVSYSWTFGDGGTGSGVAPTHAYGATGTYTVTLTVTDNLGAQGSAQTTINISASSGDQYVTSFLQWALGRPPNGEESAYWTDIFRAAYPKGLSSMKLATRELGMTVFESAEYAARNRNDHWYVYDLYKTFLMREPDVEGWAHWEAAIPIYGRDQIRRGFDESTEFANIVATLTASGAPSANVSSLATARVDPFNQSGNQLQARDAEWGVSLVSLPGRAGLDLGLGLSYSSLVWTRSGPYTYFDADASGVSPGFHIGFPTIQDKYFDARVGTNVYLLTTAAGQKVELRQVGTSNVYESADSSYLQLTYNGSLLLGTTDGTMLNFAWTGLNEYRCTWIRDRNGNYMLVNYDWRGDIQNVTDTLGRVITFVYDANANLNRIEQTWAGQSQPHVWASFGWDNQTMQPTVTGVVGIYSGETMPVLKMAAFHDGTYTKFLYNGNGQVTRITQYASDSNPATDNHPRNFTQFDYDSPSNDCPRLTATRVWAEYWTGLNGVPTEVTTQFGVEGDKHTLSVLGDPNGTVYKEAYAGNGDAAWMRGLVKSSEVWSAGVQQKLSTLAWTQDNTSAVYKTNPRVIETNVYDSVGNRRRTTVDYSVAAYAQYGLPYFVTEYAAGGMTELRRTYTDYNLSQAYLDRRIIGLVSAVHLTDAGGYQGKMTYGYDDPARLSSQATISTMHDQSYDGYFTIRGNLTSVSRWDVTDINNSAKAHTTFTNYNAAGSVVSTTDPATHTNQIGYADTFSDGNNSRSTFAYPTSVTDADGFSSTIQYNFDFGARTRVEGPPPQNQPNGAIQTFSYDTAARIERVTTVNNGAYTRYVYGPYWVQSFSTVNAIADEAYSMSTFDGAGRAFTTTTNHPSSSGGYKLVNVIFDRMGRPFRQSNPTEVNSSWLPSGDDAVGVRYSVLDFDWQGRTKRKTHPDGAYTEASYAGCGCAGGEVVTLTDEMNRQQKVYSDVLGRSWKTEVLTWPDAGGNRTVHSSAVSVFNARDQIEIANEYEGSAPTDASSTNKDVSCPTGTCQKTSMTFEGHGRLQTKHVPQHSVGTATTWEYNADDTVHKVTDARGASATYVYNNSRHLVNEIQYSAPQGITPTSDVTFSYDAAGNRTSMSDGLGSTGYTYDGLSRIVSETRQFNDLPSPMTLTYEYTFQGSVKKINILPNNTSVSYQVDSVGRVNAVNVEGFNSNGTAITQLASDVRYRAWGNVKALNYGSSATLSVAYNDRLQPSSFHIPGLIQREYQYYADGRLRYSHAPQDNRFDRSYAFDQVGRIIDAKSGAEASGGTVMNGPYRETFGYDTWSNLTSRTTLHWNTQNYGFSSAYSNNRRIGWQYDAEGNETVEDGITFELNAAGERVTTVYPREPSGEPGSAVHFDARQTLAYDGDGQIAVEANYKDMVFVYEGGQTIWQASWQSREYNVRSTVLGGRVVYKQLTSSFSQNGGPNSSQTGFDTSAYLHGKVLASYQWNSANDPSLAHTVRWHHSDPSATTVGETVAPPLSPTIWRRTELDPLSADVGTENPYPTEPPPYPPPYRRFEFASPEHVERCVLDGIDIDCSSLSRLRNAGAVATSWDQVNPNGTIQRRQGPIVPLGLDIFKMWLPDDADDNHYSAYIGVINAQTACEKFVDLMITQAFGIGVGPLTPENAGRALGAWAMGKFPGRVAKTSLKAIAEQNRKAKAGPPSGFQSRLVQGGQDFYAMVHITITAAGTLIGDSKLDPVWGSAADGGATTGTEMVKYMFDEDTRQLNLGKARQAAGYTTTGLPRRGGKGPVLPPIAGYDADHTIQRYIDEKTAELNDDGAGVTVGRILQRALTQKGFDRSDARREMLGVLCDR